MTSAAGGAGGEKILDLDTQIKELLELTEGQLNSSFPNPQVIEKELTSLEEKVGQVVEAFRRAHINDPAHKSTLRSLESKYKKLVEWHRTVRWTSIDKTKIGDVRNCDISDFWHILLKIRRKCFFFLSRDVPERTKRQIYEVFQASHQQDINGVKRLLDTLQANHKGDLLHITTNYQGYAGEYTLEERLFKFHGFGGYHSEDSKTRKIFAEILCYSQATSAFEPPGLFCLFFSIIYSTGLSVEDKLLLIHAMHERGIDFTVPPSMRAPLLNFFLSHFLAQYRGENKEDWKYSFFLEILLLSGLDPNMSIQYENRDTSFLKELYNCYIAKINKLSLSPSDLEQNRLIYLLIDFGASIREIVTEEEEKIITDAIQVEEAVRTSKGRFSDPLYLNLKLSSIMSAIRTGTSGIKKQSAPELDFKIFLVERKMHGLHEQAKKNITTNIGPRMNIAPRMKILKKEIDSALPQMPRELQGLIGEYYSDESLECLRLHRLNTTILGKWDLKEAADLFPLNPSEAVAMDAAMAASLAASIAATQVRSIIDGEEIAAVDDGSAAGAGASAGVNRGIPRRKLESRSGSGGGSGGGTEEVSEASKPARASAEGAAAGPKTEAELRREKSEKTTRNEEEKEVAKRERAEKAKRRKFWDDFGKQG